MMNALLLAALSVGAQEEEGFVPLFNGKDLTGWVNANCAPETWTVKDGVVCCTGVPTGALRTARMYENFILEAEWRHLKSGGNSGIFIWGSPISAPGVPFLRGIEVQVLDHGFNVKGKNEWYTTHGDVFPIHGATMKPLGRHSGQRSFPSEERSKPSPEWNHYRIVGNNGVLRLSVNGKEVSGGDDCNYRKGYLALESEGAPVEFRNVRIKELPSTHPPEAQTAPADQGWSPLYTGTDLRNWRDAAAAATRWKPSDWVLSQKAATSEARQNLASEVDFGEFELIMDVKVKAGAPTAAALIRGQHVPLLGPDAGKWARHRILVRGRQISIWVNEKEQPALTLPENHPPKGFLILLDNGGGVDFANIFVRNLN